MGGRRKLDDNHIHAGEDRLVTEDAPEQKVGFFRLMCPFAETDDWLLLERFPDVLDGLVDAIPHQGFLALRRSKCNSEYHLEVQRKSRSRPELSGLFVSNAAVFEKAIIPPLLAP